MSIGYVVGESKPNVVTIQSSRALPIGEYVIIEVDEGKIVGLVETSFVTSAALSDVRNFDEAEESIELAELNKRDKSHTGKILILGFLEMLRKGKSDTSCNSTITRYQSNQSNKNRSRRNFLT